MPKRPPKKKDDYKRPDDPGHRRDVPGEFDPLTHEGP